MQLYEESRKARLCLKAREGVGGVGETGRGAVCPPCFDHAPKLLLKPRIERVWWKRSSQFAHPTLVHRFTWPPLLLLFVLSARWFGLVWAGNPW